MSNPRMPKILFALLLVLASTAPALADEMLQSYVAHLSGRDHYASDGVKLTSVADILRQDRANFHKFDKADADDESDDYFSTVNGREEMERLVARSEIAPSVRRAILSGTPRVVVSLYENSRNGRRYLEVVLYHP